MHNRAAVVRDDVWSTQPLPCACPYSNGRHSVCHSRICIRELVYQDLVQQSPQNCDSFLAVQRRRSCTNLANGHHPPSAPSTPQGHAPQEVPYAGHWSPVSLPLHSAPYGVYFQAPMQMQMQYPQMQHGMMLQHAHSGGACFSIRLPAELLSLTLGTAYPRLRAQGALSSASRMYPRAGTSHDPICCEKPTAKAARPAPHTCTTLCLPSPLDTHSLPRRFAGHGQSPYIAAMPPGARQVAYMQSGMGPVPVLVSPAAMPMGGGHWAPYPPAATYQQSPSHQVYVARLSCCQPVRRAACGSACGVCSLAECSA